MMQWETMRLTPCGHEFPCEHDDSELRLQRAGSSCLGTIGVSRQFRFRHQLHVAGGLPQATGLRCDALGSCTSKTRRN